MPAIVVRDHGDGGVTNLGLAREFRFGYVCHANHVEMKLAVHVSFRERGKLRAFHADVSAAAMRLYAGLEACVTEHHGELRTYRMIKAHVSHESVTKKSGHAQFCAIIKLVRNQKVHRLHI